LETAKAGKIWPPVPLAATNKLFFLDIKT